MNITPEKLYSLLPAIYRIRDVEQGGVLKQLVTVFARQAQLVERDISNLYANWFIETCDEWAVPYLGDLLGVKGIHAIEAAGFSQRARVANTLLYRQRKGAASMLQQLAADATGWQTAVVEFFNLLGITQHLNHIRPTHFQAPDLRNIARLETLDSAFDSVAHTADVRHISTNPGRYNISNIGIFVWRLQNYKVDRAPAAPSKTAGDPRCTFHPLGGTQPLSSPTGPLSRIPLYRDVEAIRTALAAGTPYASKYFGSEPAFRIWLNDALVDPAHISICDLGDPPNLPPAQKMYNQSPVKISVGVDPQLGRIALPAGAPAAVIETSYSYSFSGDVGAGSYDRRADLGSWLTDRRAVDWQIGVSKSATTVNSVTTLSEALLAWGIYSAAHPGTSGLIVIMDNATYGESLKVQIPAQSALMITAAGWSTGITGEFEPLALRPVIAGDVTIVGAPGDATSSFTLDGVIVQGNVNGTGGGLGTLRIGHSTLVPTSTPAVIDAANVQLRRSICGPLTLTGTQFRADDSIVGTVIAASSSAIFESCTVFGTTRVRELQASNTIFTAGVTSVRRQTGCVRFSYVPSQSGTPRRYRCQPDLALQTESDPTRQAALKLRLTPAFTSNRFGDAAYAQLSLNCASELRTGADDGSEMGAFHYLQQPQREINLRSSLDEYLRFGLEAGIIFMS
jgi:hypothetical protein